MPLVSNRELRGLLRLRNPQGTTTTNLYYNHRHEYIGRDASASAPASRSRFEVVIVKRHLPQHQTATLSIAGPGTPYSTDGSAPDLLESNRLYHSSNDSMDTEDSCLEDGGYQQLASASGMLLDEDFLPGLIKEFHRLKLSEEGTGDCKAVYRRKSPVTMFLGPSIVAFIIPLLYFFAFKLHLSP